MPADFRLLLTIYQELYNLTDVAMTPLIGTALEQAGYDATYSLVSTPITNVPKLPEVLNYKHPKLTVKDYPNTKLPGVLSESRLMVWIVAQQHLFFGQHQIVPAC